MTTPRPNLNAKQRANLDRRRWLVSVIHAQAAKLGLDEATYRAAMAGQTGKTSCKALAIHELENLKKHFDRLLGREPQPYAGRATSRPGSDKTDLVKKVDALLAELHRITGRIHTRRYADAIANKRGWGSAVEFCSPENLHKLAGVLQRTVNFKIKATGGSHHA